MPITTPELIALGITQKGTPLLHQPSRAYSLPDEHDLALADWEVLCEKGPQIRVKHPTDKGLGLAGVQVGIPRRIAWFIRDDKSAPIMLLNSNVIRVSEQTDVKPEGCFSFIDVRGDVERPRRITIENYLPDGMRFTMQFALGDARLILHELDHWDGLLYADRMKPGDELISYEEYLKRGNTVWEYQR